MTTIKKLCNSLLLACFLLSALGVFPATAQTEIFAEGELCTQAYGLVYCYPLTFNFNPQGGPVAGSSAGSTSFPIEGLGTIGTSFDSVFTGEFAGGDGGQLEGTWTSTANVTLPDGLSLPADMPALMQSTSGGTWEGNLYADGTGSGTFQATDSFGVNSGGTWQVTFSGTAFEITQPTQTTAPPASTPTTEGIATAPPAASTTSPGPTLDANALFALGDLQAAVQRQLALIQSGGVSDNPAVLSPWLYGQVVRVDVEEDRPFVSDLFGHRVKVDENGLPQGDPAIIESPSAEVVNAHPDLNWSSILDTISESAFNAFNNFTEPAFQFIEKTQDGIQPADIASDFYAFLNQLSDLPVEGLSPGESSIVRSEGAILENNQKRDLVTVESPEGEKIDVQQAVETLEEEEQYTWREHYVEVLKQYSPEEWDRLVEQGLDPASIGSNRQAADEALTKFNTFFGEQSISDLAVKFDVLPAEVNSMKLKLKALGVDSGKAEELAQATLALRVITELASDHTVSSEGMFDKIVWVFGFLAVNRASQDALLDELEGKVELSPAQIDLIMQNRGSDVVKALTGMQDPEHDPLLAALAEEVERRGAK